MHALSGGSAAASNRAVKAHDGGHHAIDLLGGFFFVGFDVPGRVGADEDVVHLNLSTPVHPRTDRQYRPKLGHKNTRQVTPWGVLPGGRNLPRFFLWIGTDYHRRTPYGIADGWEIVEMRGIEPRSDVASTGLLRAQFMRTLLFGSGTCINTYTDEPSHVKVPPAPATRASSSGLLSRCR